MRFNPAMILRAALLGLCCALLTACGGGGGGGGGDSPGASPTATATPLNNFATIVVDAGPAALKAGPNGYTSFNVPFVTVTLCVPGTSTCQTIDHIMVDTGSVGLRIVSSALNATMLSGLPNQQDGAANPVGTCYAYVDGYVFGSVRQADFQIGSKSVANMPLQVIGDSGAFQNVPTSCSSGGGTQIATIQDLGGNGVIGIGTTPTDCGAYCTITGGSGAAIYYDCPATGCAAVIARTATTTAPFQQLPNPVAAFASDNNGTVMSLPSVPSTGSASVTGTLYFGIGTQTNNGLGAATVLTTSSSGDFTATYKGAALALSFLDSGSNHYFFVDSAIPACTASGFTSDYCPISPLALAATLTGKNGVTANGDFTLYNAQTEPSVTANAAPGIGANPNLVSGFTPIANSFDFGLPFFYGRKVFTAIQGRQAAGTIGPYIAF